MNAWPAWAVMVGVAVAFAAGALTTWLRQRDRDTYELTGEVRQLRAVVVELIEVADYAIRRIERADRDATPLTGQRFVAEPPADDVDDEPEPMLMPEPPRRNDVDDVDPLFGPLDEIEVRR